MTELLDAELLKDLSKPLSFDGNDAEYQDFRSLQLSNPHELRQHSLSTVDRQVRSRAESDLPGSSEIAGRCTPEMMHRDILLVGFGHERQCPNSCPTS